MMIRTGMEIGIMLSTCAMTRCSTKSEEDKIGGFFDIYYLKMRENDDELDFFITEVAYEFCDY